MSGQLNNPGHVETKTAKRCRLKAELRGAEPGARTATCRRCSPTGQPPHGKPWKGKWDGSFGTSATTSDGPRSPQIERSGWTKRRLRPWPALKMPPWTTAGIELSCCRTSRHHDFNLWHWSSMLLQHWLVQVQDSVQRLLARVGRTKKSLGKPTEEPQCAGHRF